MDRRAAIPAVIASVLAANGLLNLLTGLAPVFGSALGWEAPTYFQPAFDVRYSGLISVVLGIFLIVLARGLWLQRRRCWFWASVLLALLMANNLYRGTTPYTAVVSGGLLASLLIFHKRFTVSSERRMVHAELFALISILVALTVRGKSRSERIGC